MGKSRPRRHEDRREQIACRLDRVLICAIALFLFITPLFFSPSISEYGYGKSIVALVGISVLTLIWSAAAWVRGSWSVRWPWITAPVLLFVVASLLSLLAAVNGRVVIQSLLLVVAFFHLLLLIANVVRHRRDVHLLLGSLLASGFLAGVYGLLQYIGVLRGPFGGIGLNEVISVMGNRNFLGGFLAYLLFPSAILVLFPRQRWRRAIACVLISFCFGIVLLVEQDATVVALIATSVVFVVGIVVFRCSSPIRRNRGWILLLIALLGIAFSVHAPSGPLNSVVGLSADEPGPFVRYWRTHGGWVREIDYGVAWEMFKDSPIVGIGLGQYKIRFLEYKSAFLASPRGAAYGFSVPPAAQAHNDYLQTLAELGLLGGLAVLGFLVLLGAAIGRRLRRAADPEERLELLLLTCGILPYLLHATVSFPAHLPASSLAFVALTGLALSPVYGNAAMPARAVPRRWIRPAAVCLAVVGVVISGIALSDLHANVLMQRAVAKLHLGDAPGAEELLQQSLRYDFAPRQTYFFLARAQLLQNRHEDAWTNLERCLTRYVDEGVYVLYAGLAANRGELEKAERIVELLLQGNPPREVEQQARYTEALIAFQARDYGRAAEVLESLTKDHPTYALGFLALGDLYALRGQPAGARRALEQALVLIDAALGRAHTALASDREIRLSDYGQLQGEIALLETQRKIAIERLAELP